MSNVMRVMRVCVSVHVQNDEEIAAITKCVQALGEALVEAGMSAVAVADIREHRLPDTIPAPAPNSAN